MSGLGRNVEKLGPNLEDPRGPESQDQKTQQVFETNQTSHQPLADIVYIDVAGAAERHDWVLEAIERNKHVLCEKPLSADVAVAKKLMALAQRSGVFLMEVSGEVRETRSKVQKTAYHDFYEIEFFMS